MKILWKTLFFLTISIFLTSCAVKEIKTMSLEEAKQHSLKFKTSSFTPPKRTIDDIKKFYTKGIINEELKGLDCESDREMMTYNSKRAMKFLIKNPKSYYSKYRPLSLSEEMYFSGKYKEIINYLKDAESYLPYVGEKVSKARYNAVISFLYAELGNKLMSSTYHHLAKDLWEASNWKDTSRGKLYSYVTKSSLSELDGNLPAQEYYLRKVLALISDVNLDTKPFGVRPLNIQIKLIENLVLQNRSIEAENLARTVLLDEYNKFQKGNELVLTAFSKALFKQGRIKDALFLAKTSIKVHRINCSYNAGYTLSEAKNNLISILLSQGKIEEILEIYKETKRNLDKKTFNLLYGNNKDILLAKLLKNSNSFSLKEIKNASSIEELEYNSFLALEMLKKNKKTLSYRLFEENLIVLLKKGDFQKKTSSSFQNRLKILQNAFISLLLSLEKNEKNSNLIFQLFEYNDTSLVQRALNASSLRAASGSLELASLIRKEQDSNEQLKALTSKLAYFKTLDEKIVDYSLILKMEKKVLQLRDIKKAFLLEIENKFPKYSQLIKPKLLDFNDIQGVIKPKEALFIIKSNDKGSYIWLFRKGEKTKFHFSLLKEDDLNKIVFSLRKALEPNSNILGEIPAFNTALSYKLYKELLEPLKNSWKNSKDLLFVTSKSLSKLPLSLLVQKKIKIKEKSDFLSFQTRGLKINRLKGKPKNILFEEYINIPWLIKNYSISQLPSANALVTLRNNKNKKATKKFIAFADPIFSKNEIENKNLHNKITSRTAKFNRRNIVNLKTFESANISSLPRLEDTSLEVLSISKSLNLKDNTSIYLRKEASEKNVKTKDLSKYNILAFATHGLVSGDLDGLSQPALALSNPQFTQSQEDGLLTMGEILALNLNASWVILSACNTASSSADSNESISGLGRAFFYAGARSLLLTHWSVETKSAKFLTSEIFKKQEQNNLNKAQALRQAQISLINKSYKNKDGVVLYSYSHPLFWAAFSLIGDKL